MAQRERYKMRPVGSSTWVDIRQPASGMGWNFETTYTEDSARSYVGVMTETALFTNEAIPYKVNSLTAAEAATILQLVVQKRFQMHYFSPYYGAWRDDTFYVGKGSLNVGQLDNTTGLIDSISFNAICINPLPI